MKNQKNPPHDFTVPGLYFGDSNFFKAFNAKDGVKPSARGEYEITDPFSWMIKHGYKVLVKEYPGRWLDPGKFGDWIESNQYLLDLRTKGIQKSKINSNSILEGRVDIGKKCKITIFIN